jgi:hypothetical protein
LRLARVFCVAFFEPPRAYCTTSELTIPPGRSPAAGFFLQNEIFE